MRVLTSLLLATTFAGAVFACGTNSDPIADDLYLGDDERDDEGDAGAGGSSGGGRSSSSSGGGGGGSSSGGSSSSGAPATELGPSYEGEATFYNVDLGEQGNCSLPCPSTYLVAALNTADYAKSALCGGCAKVEGPDGEVVVQIWDQCPGCPQHGIDLSKTAFGKIAPTSAGRIDVRWTLVRCPWQDPMSYEVFADRIQIRNHRVPIQGVEINSGSGFTGLVRRSDNFFTGSVPSGAFTVRITGSSGEVLEDSIAGRGSREGTAQFE